MDKKSSITSLMSAFVRAYHAENAKNPIFSDTLAKRLITDSEYKAISDYICGGIDFFAPDKKNTFKDMEEELSYLVNTFLAPTPLARAAFCESALKTDMKSGTEQYVILGAGMDTFALRERELKYDVFEVDHPLTQADKISRINKAGLEAPKKLHFVGVDFTKDDLKAKLIENGFDVNKKTFFSWLGVSMYLYRDDIEKMLAALPEISPEGSSLVFDYAGAGLFLSEVPRVRCMIEMAKAGGEPMKSSFDMLSMEMLLSEYGFLAYEHIDTKEIEKRYFGDRADMLHAFEDINFVHAVLKK